LKKKAAKKAGKKFNFFFENFVSFEFFLPFLSIIHHILVVIYPLLSFFYPCLAVNRPFLAAIELASSSF